MLDTAWLDRLAAVGAHPYEIDLVVCTHLHPDHCGWNTQLIDGRWTPTFPNAPLRAVSSRGLVLGELRAGDPDRFPEFAYNRDVFEDSVAPVMEAGLVELLDDGDSPAPGVTLMATPGHTAGHWSVCYADDLDGVCFSGDTLHSPVHVLYPEWSLFPGPGSNYDHAGSRRLPASSPRPLRDDRTSACARPFPSTPCLPDRALRRWPLPLVLDDRDLSADLSDGLQ